MIDDRKTLLILNPAAGKGKGKKIADSVYEKLKGKIKDLDFEVSRYPGHLFELGQQVVPRGYGRVVSIGGDGTPFELINGLYATGKPQREIEWAMIPAGTGNSFLRDFWDVPEGDVVDRVVGSPGRRVDLVEFSYYKDGARLKKYYLNILGIGLIADILKLTNEKLKPLGPLGYSLAVLIRLFKGMDNRFTMRVDGEEVELKNSSLVISNSRYTGGAMKIAPTAETDDGLVDAIVFNEVNRREIVNIFVNVFKGKHIHHPKVDVFRGKEIEIKAEPPQLLMADGELLGETPMSLKVLPGELKILV
jgi:YegS/Rv2252/BmrU family lipid kinase